MLCPRCWGSKTNPGFYQGCESCNPCTLCKAIGTVDDKQLSPHFKLSEMLYSDTALRKGIANDPTDAIVTSLQHVCGSLLEPIRVQFGALHISSGYRSLELNTAIGGSNTSAHKFGLAADLNVIDQSITRKQVVEFAMNNITDFDQIIFEGTWVHIAHSYNVDNRKQVLMMFGGKYFPYNSNDPRVNT